MQDNFEKHLIWFFMVITVIFALAAGWMFTSGSQNYVNQTTNIERKG